MSVCIINGPNLNMLGKRESEIYGINTLQDALLPCEKLCKESGVDFAHFQSNHEGQIVDFIQQECGKFQFVIANLGAYTHTSIAIRDALLSVKIPNTEIIELHVSNVFKREEFRHKSFISDIALAVISGLGIEGYLLATRFCIGRITK